MAGDAAKESGIRRNSRFGLAEVWERGAKLPRYTWIGRARQLVRQTARGIRRAPFTFVVTVLTIAVSFALSAGFLTVLLNAKESFAHSRSSLGLSIYLSDGLPEARMEALRAELRGDPAVEQVDYRSKAQALSEFSRSLGPEAGLTEGLEDENPLPASLEVKFKRGQASPERYHEFAEHYGKTPGVAQVIYSEAAVTQLSEVFGAFRRIGWLAMLFIFAMSAFVVGNTIRLALYAHRDEIEIMQLVGAAPAYIRAPYLIEGALQGLCGGALGVSAVFIAYSVLQQHAGGSELFRFMATNLRFLPWWMSLGAVLVAAVLGIAGAFAAVRRVER